MESHEQTIRYWVQYNGCGNPQNSERKDSAGDVPTIERTVYTNPKNKIQVVDITIENGGHTWPGGWAYLPKGIIGITIRNLDADEASWDFFRQFARD